MNPARLMTVPCTVVSRVPAGLDDYGAPVLQERRTAATCWYGDPRTEEREGRVFSSLTLYFAPDVALDHVTAVEVDGVGSFEVDGQPIAHRSPRTGVPTHQTAKGRAAA